MAFGKQAKLNEQKSANIGTNFRIFKSMVQQILPSVMMKNEVCFKSVLRGSIYHFQQAGKVLQVLIYVQKARGRAL